MRLTAVAALFVLAASVPAAGQTATPVPYPYDLDPYRPRDAELLRKYGSVLVAQTPILELRKLDPHTPSHAALLRDLGGAIPLWPMWYPFVPPPASMTPFPPSAAAPAPNVVVWMMGRPDVPEPPVESPATAPAGPVTTPIRPETNDGVWIAYAGQRWISAGRAVPLNDAEFSRVGEHEGVPVYRRSGAGEDVIYVPTRGDFVAPYRLKPASIAPAP